MEDDILKDFGIGLADSLGNKDNDELFQMLNKTRSKIFNQDGKVIRQTMSKEDKALKKLEKIANDETIPLAERLKALQNLQQLMKG